MKTNALSPELLRKIDAYWRAANYLSVGQIYLYDNPLLKRPLALADVKRMLLGHWGTTPGQNFIYVHLNRVIKKYDLDMIYVSGPGHGGPAVVGNTYLEGTYSEIYPEHQPGRGRAAEAVPAVLLSRRHSQPRLAGEPGLDPRGRRAGLFAQPCLRRGVRQSRSDRRLRRRRRRGGNRAAGHRLALQQVPRSGHRRRGAADPAPERLQDRQSDHAGAHRAARSWSSCCAAMAGRRIFVEGDEPALMHQAMAATLDTAVEQIQPIQHEARVRGDLDAAALADDRAAIAQGLDRAEGGRRPADRRHLPRAPGAARRSGRASRAPPAARRLAEELPAGGAVRRAGPAEAGTGRAGARRASGAWAPIRTPTAACCCAICACRISATTRSACPCPARPASATRMCSGLSCAMSSSSTASSAISASSARTRRSPTAWKPCSR